MAEESSELTRAADGTYNIPDHLRCLHTATHAPALAVPGSRPDSRPRGGLALCPTPTNTRPFASMLTCASLPTPRNANPSARSAAPPLDFCIVNPYPCFRASKRSSRSYTVARAPRSPCASSSARARSPQTSRIASRRSSARRRGRRRARTRERRRRRRSTARAATTQPSPRTRCGTAVRRRAGCRSRMKVNFRRSRRGREGTWRWRWTARRAGTESRGEWRRRRWRRTGRTERDRPWGTDFTRK